MSWELGDRVRITHTLTRTRRRGDTPQTDRKQWEPRRRLGADEGIVVGARTLFDGTVDWGGYDEPARFEQTATVKAYLVATSMRTRPVFVLPEHMERIE